MRPALRIVFAPVALRRPCDPVRPTQGEARGRTVKIDPRMADVGKTLYHEWLHVLHPSWSEERIRAAEEIGWLRMGWKKKAELYRMFGSALIEGEETA